MKNKISCLILLVVVTITLSACFSSTPEFGSNGSNVFVHTKSPDILSFQVALFSKSKIKNIEYIDIEGKSITGEEEFAVEILNNNVDELDSYKYRGLHITNVMIDISVEETEKEIDSYEISKIVLNIDGKQCEVILDTPIIHEISENGGNTFTEELRISVIPNEFSSRWLNNPEQSVIYEFHATEELMINKVHFSDFVEATNITIALDDSEFKNAEFPIHVNQGQEVKIGMSFSSKVADQLSYVSTNLYFDYVTAKDNTERFNSAVVVFDPISPISDGDTSHIDTLIDSLFEE